MEVLASNSTRINILMALSSLLFSQSCLKLNDPTTSEAHVQFIKVCPGPGDGGEIAPGTAADLPCGPSNYELTSDVSYSSGSASHVLDIYRPVSGTGPFPTAVWIHGGGSKSGGKDDVSQALWLVCHGYAVVSVDYRLGGEAPFPAQVHDIKAAIRYLRAQGGSHGLDSERLAVFGSSAGGHLAALVGTSGGVTGLEDPSMGNAGVSSRVKAVIDWYGPTEFSEIEPQLQAQGCTPSKQQGRSPAGSKTLGCDTTNESCANHVTAANPVTYVDGEDPPFLILHGSSDCTVPQAQSVSLFESLRESGACVSYRSIVDAAHGGTEWTRPPVRQAVLDFLSTAL